MVATAIVSILIPSQNDYQELITNKGKNEIYSSLTTKIFEDKRIDVIKDYLKHKSNSRSPIQQKQKRLGSSGSASLSNHQALQTTLSSNRPAISDAQKAPKDDIILRFDRLRVHKPVSPEKTATNSNKNIGKQGHITLNNSNVPLVSIQQPQAESSKLVAPSQRPQPLSLPEPRSRSSNLSAPLNLHYRSRSPSPARPPELEFDDVDQSLFKKFENQWYLNTEELFALMRKAPKSILLLDIRNRKNFDKSHILSNSVLCIEPFSIQANFTEKELEESLLISPQDEQHLFNNRHLFDLVVFYDQDYTVTSAATTQFSTPLPNYLKKLLATLNSKSIGKPLKRNPLILNGGFTEWEKRAGENFITKPRIETLMEPQSIPSRPLTFRKTSVTSFASDNYGSLPDQGANGYTDHYNPQEFSPNSTGNSISENAPYAKNLQQFVSYSNSSLTDVPLCKRYSNINGSSSQIFFPQQQPPAYNNKRMSFNSKTTSPNLQQDGFPGSPPPIDKRSSFSSFSNLLKSSTTAVAASSSPSLASPSSLISPPTTSSPSLPAKIPISFNNNSLTNSRSGSASANSGSTITSPQFTQSPNGIKPPEPAAFSAGGPQVSALISNNNNMPLPSPSPLVASTAHNNNNSNNGGTNGFALKPITCSLDFTSGLYNLGNTCYMNCVLQCLTGTAQLSLIFLNNSYKRYINVNSKLGSKGVLANNYYEVVKLMSKTDGSYVVPSKFKNICGSLNSEFKGYEQQDCQEFLNFLLDGLHEDLNQCGGHPPMKALTEEDEARRERLPFRIASTIEWERYLKTDFSAVVDLFQGQYLSRLQCLFCRHTSTTYQAFSTLSLPIPDSNSNNKQNITIDDCFAEFTKVELLDGDNKWYCPKCRKFQKSTKVLKITRLPKVLIIHFKRFKAGFGWEKLETSITYPVETELKLEKYWTPVSNEEEKKRLSQLQIRGQVPPFNYKVYGAINHSGNIRGGHYTTFVYKGAGKGWCYYDDTKVYKNQKPSAVCSKDNYVLFWQRV